MSIPPGTARRLRERQDTIRILTILITVGPPLFTVLLFVSIVMVVVDMVQLGKPDVAALVVCVALIPGTLLSWLLRHLLLSLFDNLDICLDHPAPDGNDSPRP